eukprot:Transcript_23821.p1 GENE.Transcript_23821~~Transcript_23821.p1  ORF type:complete len:489 (+),score=120.68 Transcript_23821:94-1467(+)
MKRLREAADVSLPALLEGVNRQRPAYQDFDREDVERHVEAALRSNAAEALSVLLSCKRGDDTELYPDDRLRERGKDLVKIAVEAEAVECCLMLFSAIKKIEESSPEEVRPPRVWIISPKEALEMAQEQLQLAGRDEEGGGKRRVARALLYHAMRRPKGNNGLKPKDENRAIQKGGKFSLEADGVAVQWPEHRADMSAELCEAYGVKAGGYDISDGAEHVPVMWVNEMDEAPPPGFVYIRRCVAGDVHPDWLRKAAKECNFNSNSQGACRTEKDPCAEPIFNGKPENAVGECNWACKCPLTCAGRPMQRGSGLRLQVFKHKYKGWCLRTLSPIKKGDFIMEYVGEVISQEEHLIRTGRFPDLEDYLMDIAKPSTKIDAYLVRNIAAFAAFACRPAYANMEKKARFCSHWDKRVFHVAFLAKCNIQPGDELTYLRVDGPPPANSTKNCKCGAPGCNRKM